MQLSLLVTPFFAAGRDPKTQVHGYLQVGTEGQDGTQGKDFESGSQSSDSLMYLLQCNYEPYNRPRY